MVDPNECVHPVQVAGMCAVCGNELDVETQAEVTFSMMHSNASVKVSAQEAERLDSETASHLLSQRKLALIVDLDQTIIHATVDPTVGDWMKDENNPNFQALKDVGRFKLGIDGKAIQANHDTDTSEAAQEDASSANTAAGCWYYIKPRPGVPSILKELSLKYELHVYTMGTRSYADCVCKLVDPDGSIFGNRILSRDENGSLMQKSLSRLFPVDTSMVVIIDDRADVWRKSPNLVKVQPYDFFVGIGDINATFLPALPVLPGSPIVGFPNLESCSVDPLPDDAALPSLPTSTLTPTADESASSELSQADKSADAVASVKAESNDHDSPETLISNEAAALLEAQSQTLTNKLTEQRQARPLAKMQEALDEKLAVATTNGANGSNATANSSKGQAKEDESANQQQQDSLATSPPTNQPEASREEQSNSLVAAEALSPVENESFPSHAVLKDDDNELYRIQKVLNDIHTGWYSRYDELEKQPSPQAIGNGSESSAVPKKPSVVDFIAEIKAQVLKGCSIVFSSMFPQGHGAESSEVWKLATEHGGECRHDIKSGVTTHVVAARPGTVKVNRGHKANSIQVVWPGWLYSSVAKGEKQPETWYQLPAPGNIDKLEIDVALSDEEKTSYEWVSKMGGDDLDGDGDDENDKDDDHEAGIGLEGDNALEEGDFAGMDWGEAADEVDAYLDDDDEETDLTDNDDRGENTTRPSFKRSRSESVGSLRNASDSETDGEGDSRLLLRSPLSKRRKRVQDRQGKSGLKQSITSSDLSIHPKDQTQDSPSMSASETASIDESFLDDLANEIDLQMDKDSEDDHTDEG